MSYPGGKAGAGVFQRLINEMPPHDVYVAAFAGHDAIARNKKPAARNILIDRSDKSLDYWSDWLAAGTAESVGPSWELHRADCIEWLHYRFDLTRVWPAASSNPATVDPGRWFVYFDPPYLHSTRTGGDLYEYEMTEDDHDRLLDLAEALPCMVMISGYLSEMYRDRIGHWRTFQYQTTVRSGERRTEWAWCNFPKPTVLHDTRFLGNNKREREKIRRRVRRLAAGLQRMPQLERQAILDSLKDQP